MICDSPDILKIMKLIKLIIMIIRIIVPIILIVSLMFDFTKAVSSSDSNSLSKTGSLAVNKMIAAILIFLIPTFVSMLVGLVDPNNSYKKCFDSANVETISSVYKSTAKKLVNAAKKEKTINAVNTARNYLSNVDDKTREQYEKELQNVEDDIRKKEQAEAEKKKQEQQQQQNDDSNNNNNNNNSNNNNHGSDTPIETGPDTPTVKLTCSGWRTTSAPGTSTVESLASPSDTGFDQCRKRSRNLVIYIDGVNYGQDGTYVMKVGQTITVQVKLPTMCGKIDTLTRTSHDGVKGWGGYVRQTSSPYVNRNNKSTYVSGVDGYKWTITAKNPGCVKLSQTAQFDVTSPGGKRGNMKSMIRLRLRIDE